ncbi:oxoglutarate semialdehyde dehydrogenase [Roseomonas mucosa]|uniref:2,5-dioxovalerate dehydrogenase n=1 Tax=Roseomonas mucosa TaxID=207340 RepID=A0A4Y1N240_9PROT|nr:aldehyde dehydrogenase (NADP(+)) [Roseomonas mucosa]AWV23844.1 oxoglutarate semialdehyde dehydrogenase [Roseomonas mucosa]MDT8356019.1 aldehyde dehydrogenase (NADP(+)) [Roseomonas mucosa]MDU7522110.1 aldehyde dehydrogenase (NADP(+)) [Roseomonas mucosa]QDJ10768.1 oxoglutarate semialdehyde dehydrogenase [Roseomonas mucosa]
MQLTGEMLIGASAMCGTDKPVQAIEAQTGKPMEPSYGGGSAADVDRACGLAWAAFDTYRETSLEDRARFLEAIASNIMDLGDALIERTMAESGLPRGRIEGERGRTTGQLRLFAEVVREGSWLEARIDPPLADRKPLPRVDLRQRHIAVGPVAVFGASNFPLAFSVAGGDTASALAAGCPVVVKAHSAHPGTSEMVGRAIQAAVQQCGLPEGTFSLLYGSGAVVGQGLVANPHIKAVGFTGSRSGGTALMKTAAARPEPIPVYAEMSSINPVFLLPHALAKRAEALGKGFVGSLTLGAGQFCTNPGLVMAAEGPDLTRFLGAATEALGGVPAQTMLTPGILKAYQEGIGKLAANKRVEKVAEGQIASGDTQGQAAIFATKAEDFIADPSMEEEVFGAASLVIRCQEVEKMKEMAEKLEGQLTATVLMEPEDMDFARALLPILERRVGRILINGFPTGVEVSHAMVHGGPYPSTSDGRTTSVGTLAIRRFLRPVCYQDFPAELLPEALRDGNPLGLWRRIDGALGKN